MDDSLSEDFEHIFTGERSHETFVQFYNLTIKSFKGSPEYVSIIKDMELLISLDKSELEKRIKNVNFDIKNFNNAEEENKHKEYFYEAWSRIDLKSEINFLKKMQFDSFSPDETNIGFIFLLGKILVDEYETKFIGEDLLVKNKALAQFLTNINMEFNFKKLISSTEFQDIPIELVYTIGNIGIDHSLFESTEILQNDQLQDLMHKIISSRNRNKGHLPRQKKYKAALVYAEDNWAKGDNRNINKMAESLLWLEEFESLSYDTLKEKLRPIATKYKKLVPRGRPSKKKHK